MKIKTRGVGGKYLDINIYFESMTVNLGLHDDNERKDLAKTLRDAADEIMQGLEEEEV